MKKFIKWIEIIACPVLIVGSIYCVYIGNNLLGIYLALWAIFLRIDRDIF